MFTKPIKWILGRPQDTFPVCSRSTRTVQARLQTLPWTELVWTTCSSCRTDTPSYWSSSSLSSLTLLKGKWISILRESISKPRNDRQVHGPSSLLLWWAGQDTWVSSKVCQTIHTLLSSCHPNEEKIIQVVDDKPHSLLLQDPLNRICYGCENDGGWL